MNLKVDRIDFTIDGHRVLAERAGPGRDDAYLTLPNDAWLARNLSSDQDATQEVQNLIWSATGNHWTKVATRSEVRDVVDLIRRVTG